MKIVGILPVRNEAWVLGFSLRALLMWCDEVIVWLHACTDNSGAIASEVMNEEPEGRVLMLNNPYPVWHEMAQRQALLEGARARGATHVAILDADEVLTANMLNMEYNGQDAGQSIIRRRIATTLPGQVRDLPMYSPWRDLDSYRVDPWCYGSQGQWTAAWFADARNLCWKTEKGYDHHHRAPHGYTLGARQGPKHGEAGILHLQFASWRRLTAKQALYRMNERIRWPEKPLAEINRTYGYATDEKGLKTAPLPAQWLAGYEHLMKYLDVDAEPWQEGECKRLWTECGAAMFKGLDLLGVV